MADATKIHEMAEKTCFTWVSDTLVTLTPSYPLVTVLVKLGWVAFLLESEPCGLLSRR